MIVEPGKHTQSKILIAEDEAIVAEDLSMTLRDMGYPAAGVVSTGEEAVQLAKELKPALVLMDIKLGGEIDGIQASEQIRSQLDIPVIFLTAYDEQDVLCRAKQTEPYGFLAKPFSQHILKITLETALYKHKADQRVRESESLYRALVEATDTGYVVIDQHGRVVDANSEYARLTGHKGVHEIIGRSVVEWTAEQDKERNAEELTKCFRKGYVRNLEMNYQDAKGNVTPIEINASVIKGDSGTHIVTLCRDITERKRAEEEARTSEHRSETIAETITEVFWMADIQTGKTFYVSPGYERVWGRSVASLYENPHSFLDALHYEDHARVITALEAKKDGRSFDLEYRIIRPDGGMRWIWDRGFPVFDEMGEVTRYVGVAQDITARKEVEEALKESENRYRSLVETSPDPIIVYDLEGKIITVNQQAAHAYGVESPELVLAEIKNVSDILDQDSREKAARNLEQILATGSSRKNEYTIIRKDGSTMPVEINSAIVKRADGKPVAFVSAVRDIADRKKADEALRASEDRYRQITENSLTGIFIHQDGVGVFANQRLADMLGYTKEEMIGRNLFDAVHPDDHEIVRARVQARLSGELSPVPHQLRLVKKTGEVFWCDILATRIDYRGRPAIMGNLADITDRKKAEAALRDSERRYSTFLNSTTDLAFLKDEEFRYVMVNKANQAFFGKDEVEIIGKTDFELLTPSAAEACRRSDVEALASDRIIVTEEDVMGRIFETKKFAVDLENGQRGVGGLIREVTDRTKAEEALREREASLRAILNNAPFLMWLKDSEGRFLAVNDVFAKSCGQQSSEAVVGKTDLDVWPVDLAESYRADDREVMHQKRQKQVEEPVFDQGVTRWFETFKTPILDEAGNVIGTTGFAREITGRKLAEESLRNLLNFRQTLIDSIPNPVFYKDEKGNYIDCNEAFALLLGLPREDVVGKSVYEVVPKDLADLWHKKDQELFEDPHVQVFECTMARPDGTERSLIFHKAPLFDPDGALSGLIGVILDITERKEAEEALRESEEKYRLVVEKAQEAIFIVQDGLLRFVNPKTVEIMSYTEEELVGKSITDFLYPDDRKMVLDRHMRQLSGEEFPSRYAFRIVDKRGAVKWVEIDSDLMSWGGRPAALIFMSDITERKRREESLKESEEWHRTLVEQSFDGVFVQKGSRIMFANSRLYEMLGYSAGELEGLDHWKVYHPDYQTITRDRAVARLRGEEVVSQYDVKLQRKDGTSFDAEISAKKVEVHGEAGVQVWARDTSKRKRSEEVQRRLATAIEQSAEAIVITDSEGNIQYVNPSYEMITGYSRDEVMGQKPTLLRIEEMDSPSKRSVMETISRGERWSGHLVKKRKDGGRYEEEVTVTPVIDPRGAIVNYVVVKRDVTKETGLQRQLLQAQKMEAIGTLAGGVAHDFNNILQVTLGYTELMLDDESLPSHCRADLRKVYDSSRRGADLVQRLLMFSRKTEMKPRPLNLNRRIEELRKMLERTLPKMIDIQLLLGDGLATINADPIQIDQILMNLAVNARDAMPDGGKLIVETANIILDEEYAKTHLDTSPGHYVRLMITDTGSGMDRDTLEHIFEPFYTTKGVGEGTGLGLAMVHGIVKQHSGHIKCYSEPGDGTSFKIYFPALVASAEPAEAALTEMPRGGDETILLVDDEKMIRDLGSRILTKAGYKVITASDGEEALKKFQLWADEISLVVLDVIMPTLGGKQCLEALLRLNPSVKVVIASGFSANGPTKDALAPGAKGFVNKPYDMRQMLEIIREVLDAEG